MHHAMCLKLRLRLQINSNLFKFYKKEPLFIKGSFFYSSISSGSVSIFKNSSAFSLNSSGFELA